MGSSLRESVTTGPGLDALYEISLAVARGVKDPAEIAGLAVLHAAGLLSVEGGACFVWNPRTEFLEPIFETSSNTKEAPRRPGEGMVGIAFGERRTIRVDDYGCWDQAIPESKLRGMGGAIAVPLIVDGVPIGALGVWTYQLHHFSDEDGRLLEVFASQVAPSLAALPANQTRESQARIFEILQRLAATSAGAHDPAILARVAIESARELLGGDTANVNWYEPGEDRMVPLAYSGPPQFAARAVIAPNGAAGLCLRSREPVVVTDYPTWAHALPLRVSQGQTSIVVVPMLVGKRPLGTISVSSYGERRFTDRDAELLNLLVSQVAPALESARLLVESRGQVARLRALNEVAAAARSKLEAGQLAQLTVDRARELVGADGATISLWEVESDRLVPIAGSEAGPNILIPRPAGQGAAGRAFSGGETILVNDYPSWSGNTEHGLADQIQSVLVVPLTVGERRLGTLGVYSRGPRLFTEQDADLMNLLSAQIAPALESSRLLAEAETRLAGLQALHELAVAAGGILDAAALAELTVEHASRLLGTDAALLRWWDPEAQTLRLMAQLDSRQHRMIDNVASGQGVAGLAFARQEPVLIQDYDTSPEALPWSREQGVRSAFGVPLMVGSRAVGVLVAASYQTHYFGPDQMRMLQLVAAQVAPAIEAARLTEARERQNRTLLGIHELAVAASVLLDSDQVTRLAQEKARDLLGVDSAGLAWWDSDQEALLFISEEKMDHGPIPRQGRGEGVVGIAFDRGEPFQVSNYPTWEGAIAGVVAAGEQSLLAVPLRVADRVVGSLVVRSRTQRVFSDDEVRLLAVLGAQVGPALEAARLHASLASSEERFRSLYEGLAAGVLIVDRHGITLDCNQAAATIMECDRSALIGAVPTEASGWTRLWPDGTPMRRDERPTAIALATKRPVRSSLMRIQRGGIDKWLQFDGIPLLDASGEIDRVITSFLDVSSVKQAETAKRENEAKDRFLAAMSHELRTPLNSILGFGQLLQDTTLGELSDRQGRYVHNIISSGRHLLELVNDVLDLSKVAAGQMDIQTEDFELRRLLEEAITRIRPLAGAKRIDLRLEGRGRPWARADHRRLEQVVWNLLSNAIKFTPEGGRVTLSTGTSRSWVWIEVTDTGIGIPPEHHDRIFREFTQVETGRDRPHEGTGLGLALSRELVAAMGGTVAVTSTPGEGSKFKVTIPRAESLRAVPSPPPLTNS